MTIASLMIAGCCYIIAACHKPDIPRKKQCQITRIEDIYTPNPNPASTIGYLTDYAYTKKRLLDSLSVRPALTAGTPVNVKISYNSTGNPVDIKDNANRVHKLIYENGRVVRVDMLGTDNLFHPKYTFVYDSLGRIIDRMQGSIVIRWEYQGDSKNFIRRLHMADMNQDGKPEVFMSVEYQYDDKVNPMTTWPNTTLVPFYFEVVENSAHEFEPIPENNWVYQRVRSLLHASLLTFREYYYSYQYDDVYPVKYDLVLATHNPFLNRVDTTRGSTTFTYECKNNHVNF